MLLRTTSISGVACGRNTWAKLILILLPNMRAWAHLIRAGIGMLDSMVIHGCQETACSGVPSVLASTRPYIFLEAARFMDAMVTVTAMLADARVVDTEVEP